MHSLVVPISKITLAHKVNNSDMIIRKRHKLITEKYSIRIIVQVEVINSKIVKSFQALIAQDGSRECVKFREKVLWMISIIWLK